MQPGLHIAIVGCGFSGTSAFFQLIDRAPVGEVTIFEMSGDYGPGYAYRTDECVDYLINNTTDSMCLTPESKRAFIDWLNRSPYRYAGVSPDGHLPRRVYGAFLKDVFEATQVAANVKGVRVRLVSREVTALDQDPQGKTRLRWHDGSTVVDKVILTTGRCRDLAPGSAPPAGASAHYLKTHINNPAMAAIPTDARVGILGASLSAYDIVNRLFAPDTGCRFRRTPAGQLAFHAGSNARRVVLASRTGRLKALQSRHPHAPARTVFNLEHLRQRAQQGELSLNDVRALIDQEAAANGVSIDWAQIAAPYAACTTAEAVTARAAELLEHALANALADDGKNILVDLFASAQQDIWDAFAEQLLAPEEERRYRKDFETTALSYAAPCPIPTAEKLLALLRAGRLSVVTGVRNATLSEDGNHYRIEHAHGEEACTVLINATGSVDRDIESKSQPALIRNLVERNQLQAYRRGGHKMPGAAVKFPSMLAQGTDSIYLANMLLWGPGYFTSSAYTMATIVDQIVTHISSTFRAG
ncbi:MAG: FAD/NAD(P)-binding protein [Pseudomonadota bacterium]